MSHLLINWQEPGGHYLICLVQKISFVIFFKPATLERQKFHGRGTRSHPTSLYKGVGEAMPSVEQYGEQPNDVAFLHLSPAVLVTSIPCVYHSK